MAIGQVNRRKLWFGTPNSMRWMPTPNRGADVSPSGWGTSGTTLNGGGYAFNSFGSHKQYVFEWPSTSSREDAQMLKSYADGTYGRDLIYFVDPLTYTTNVLPAQWADPSIGLGFEGSSLVYGVEPSGLPADSGVNDLPVRSATYDLTSIAPGFRGVEDALFVPIPEGHTLFLGAIYTATGTGGVFASPLLDTGAIGAASRLTELPANTDTIVSDPFNGARGVYLWVGKTSAGAASATLRGMVGRLLPTEQAEPPNTPDIINYAPRIEGSGTWAEVARFNTGDPAPEMVQPEDFRIRDLGTGESVLEIERVSGLTATNCIAGVSTREGKPAVRLIPTDASSLSYAWSAVPIEARTGGTALGTLHLDAPVTGSLNTDALSIRVHNPAQRESAPNMAGEYPLRLGFSELTSGNTFRLYHGGAQGSGDVWWTDIGLFEGDYTGPWFDGDLGTVIIDGKAYFTFWNPDGTSTAHHVSPQLQNIRRGPWIGGQGHSGVRFLGKPSYVVNGPINGGQIGFAASFIEVGLWANG